MNNPWSGKMAYSEKCLPHYHEALILYSQHPYKMMAHDYKDPLSSQSKQSCQMVISSVRKTA